MGAQVAELLALAASVRAQINTLEDQGASGSEIARLEREHGRILELIEEG